MDIQGLDANRGKQQQQKVQQQRDDAVRFNAILGQKSAEVMQQRIAPMEDVRKHALRKDKFLQETGEAMDADEVAEELFESKRKRLVKKVEDVLRSQQQGLGL